MSNREIIDYILSNKLKKDEVIKETCIYYDSEESEEVMYIFNNETDLWDDNGKISITSFCDVLPQLSGNIAYKYTYEIISKEQAQKELRQKENLREIERLKSKLSILEEEVKDSE